MSTIFSPRSTRQGQPTSTVTPVSVLVSGFDPGFETGTVQQSTDEYLDCH
ncbi:hypothetical protein SAMN04489842_3580 [Natronobacterium texcoconense]|uniref:Uncharacterized protein n=1 Tax=Natronobacterium texcoconense TaxID=1095778 RepID=A0A1H1IKI2_NATTX|nr:hypothetical protein SAMN04489842_3580 [Natronobacterium texcoconense]